MNIFRFFLKRPKNKQPEVLIAKKFSYKYQQHPFDDWQNFSVSAMNQEEANVLATVKFAKMFNEGKTVMTNFFPE
jgi:hypothetical protein